MFTDAQDGVDRQLFAPQAEGILDGRENRDAILTGHLNAHFSLGELIAVEADDVAAGVSSLAPEVIRSEKILDEDVGMAAIGERSEDDGDSGPARGFRSEERRAPLRQEGRRTWPRRRSGGIVGE